MKKLAYVLFLGCFACLFSCKKDKSLADLLFEFAKVGTEEVDVNTPLTLESSIENAPLASTETAGANDRSLRVQYRADENSPWVDAQLVDQDGNVTYELVKPVPSLKPGTKHKKSEGFAFPVPGIYRYGLEADVFEVVAEREETNNEASSGDGFVRAATNPAFQLTVKVKDPSGLIQPVYGTESVVRIQYLGEK